MRRIISNLRARFNKSGADAMQCTGNILPFVYRCHPRDAQLIAHIFETMPDRMQLIMIGRHVFGGSALEIGEQMRVAREVVEADLREGEQRFAWVFNFELNHWHFCSA